MGGKPGPRSLFIGDFNRGACNLYHFPVDGTSRQEEIACLTLDEIFEGRHIKSCDFLKMDCEGAEHEILSNFHHFDLVSKVALEYHQSLGLNMREEMLRILKEHGFDIVFVDETLVGRLLARRHEKQ